MKLKVLMLFITSVMLSSCDEKLFTGNVNCDECFIDKPTDADLIIDLTISYKYPEVPLTVYRGEIEENNVEYADTAISTPYYINVPVGHRYSVKAEYRESGEVIYAVDGTNLKVLSVSDACDATCYIIENDRMDTRLKKEFQ